MKYDFVDYIQGGLNIALYIGIDFTASNGTPDKPSSLHYLSPDKSSRNQYQESVHATADVLLDYDADKMVPVYGFGAVLKFPNLKTTSVSQCFPCTGDPNNDEVEAIDGIFQAYNNALNHVDLCGPTHFAPLFRNILEKTKQSEKENPDNYTIFLILTDGEIHDMDETVLLLIEACRHPVSIVIVGVGSQSFDNMRVLDAGQCADKNGNRPSRDICRFVCFK